MNQRLSLDPAAPLDSLPWDCVDAVGLPVTSFGKPVEWQTDYVPRPVYIGRCELPEQGELLVFGVRYEFAQRTDPPPASGYFVRYLVVETTTDGPIAHVLGQQRSSTFQSLEETSDSVFCSDLKKAAVKTLCLSDPPRWKAGSAQWPLLRSTPMFYLAQFSLPENEVTRLWLTFNESVFLFWREEEGQNIFKITTQETRFQSDEDHYRAEARRLK